MPKELAFVQIDAFAQRPFEGNPAVVCAPGESMDAGLMQRIAQEMNVSETCFLVPDKDVFRLRWFTPTSEVDLCGHATLAAAHALWNEWGYGNDHIRFESLSGPLNAVRLDGRIWLDFPSEAVDMVAMPDRLAAALPGAARAVARNRLDYLVEMETEAEVRSARPDFRLLASVADRGVMITAAADQTDGADFVSRYFAPGFGIDEDPVTGSTHCALGPYWAERLGKRELTGYQASDRGGWVHVRVGDNRVQIGGSAVIVARGTLSV